MAASKKAWRRRIGRATVYQRGGRFWIYYRDYKPVRRPVGTSREEALALAAKINVQLADGAPTMLAFQPIAVTAMICANIASRFARTPGHRCMARRSIRASSTTLSMAS